MDYYSDEQKPINVNYAFLRPDGTIGIAGPGTGDPTGRGPGSGDPTEFGPNQGDPRYVPRRSGPG